MAFFEQNTSNLAKAYYDKWLNVATNGNVSYAAEYDTCFNRTRVRFTCKCGSMLELKPSDMMDVAVAVPFEAQEFVKLHKHEQHEACVTRFCPTCNSKMSYVGMSGTERAYHCPLGCKRDLVDPIWREHETRDKPFAPLYDEMKKFGPGHIVDVGGHEKKVYQYLGTNKSWEVIAQPALKKSAPALKKSTGRRFR